MSGRPSAPFRGRAAVSRAAKERREGPGRSDQLRAGPFSSGPAGLSGSPSGNSQGIGPLFALVLTLTVGVLSACERGVRTPSSANLLENAALQDVVALQAARDGRALVRKLGDPDATVRARAAFALGSLQYAVGATDLVGALSDPFPAVRAEAAFALGQLPQSSREVESALVEAAERETDRIARTRHVEALGKVGRAPAAEWLARLPPSDPAGVVGTLALARTLARGVATQGPTVALISRLTDSDARVRELAGWGLANALRESSWAAWSDQVYRALDGYERTDPAAVQLLRAVLRLPDPAAKERARAWLEESPEWRARVAATEGLTAATEPLDRSALLTALDDPSPHVRHAAAAALLGSPLESAELDRVERWVEAHAEERPTNGALIRVLASRGRSARAIVWLESLPADDPTGWQSAIDAVALVPGAQATRALYAASQSDSRIASGAAARALALRWVTEREAPPLDSLYYRAFVRALRDRDPGLAPMLAGLLSEQSFRALGSDSVLADARALSARPEPSLAEPDWALLKELGDRPRLVLATERGDITAELFPGQAPLTVSKVAELARAGRYDGVRFHRVLPNFMVQGGDVTRGDGLGDPGFRIKSELTHLRYERGTVGMARTEKDTEGSQFFITHSIQPHLDGAYTAFGRVIDGLDVVDELLEGDRITRATVEPVSDAREAAP